MLVTFDSISSSLQFQAGCAASGERVLCTLIPVPRSLSASCGYAAEVAMGEPGDLLKLLGELKVEWNALYRPRGKEYEVIEAVSDGW
jgi:hypothetical protein